MQPRPTAVEILRDVAALLDDVVVPALTGPAQHQARVAASLVGIIARELELAPAGDVAERAGWLELLRTEPGGSDDTAGTSLLDLRRTIADALRAGAADDPEREAAIWPVLLRATVADLAVVKPGHDAWVGD